MPEVITRPLNTEQKNNIQIILAAMAAQGVTNTYAKLALLGNVYKECQFLCVKERVANYLTTPNDRTERALGLRQIFRGGRLDNKDDSFINNLKSQGVAAFIDYVYGGTFGQRQLGNDPNGRGPNSDAK